MSLTIPRSSRPAGRAASIRIATPDTGDAIAQFGQLVQEKGMAIDAARNEMAVRRTQLDFTRELGQARLEFEQVTDPDAIDAGWGARVDEIKQKYLGPGEDGKPRWDAQTAGALDLAFGQLNNAHMLDLGERSIKLRQSQMDGEWVGIQEQISAEALNADPRTLEAFFGLGDAAIDKRLERGSISPEDAAVEKANFRNSILSSRAAKQIMADPEGFLSAAEQGGYAAMKTEDLAKLQLTAQGEIARRDAAAAKDAEAAAKEKQTAIGTRLSEMTSLMAQGFKVTDEAFLDSPEVLGHKDAPKALAARSLRDEKPGFQTMTVAEFDQQIAAEMAAPKTHEYQAERVEVLKQWRAEAAQKSDTDFIAYAQNTGLTVPELPDFDPENPDAFAAGLRNRLTFDQGALERGQTRTQAVLSVEEKARLKTVLDPKADPAPKLALAQSVLTASGGRIDRLASVMEADPVFARATRAMAATGNPALAEAILRGQQKSALGTVNLPTEKQMTTIFDQFTGSTFQGDPKLKAELIASARALYADEASGVNPEGEDSIVPFLDDTEAQDLFRASVQRVLGASADRNGAMSVGGLQEVNDGMVYLPPGVAAAEVEDSWDMLGKHLQGQVPMDLYGERTYGYDPDKPAPDMLRAFKAASINGAAPNLTSKPLQFFNNLTMRRVGETEVYELTYTHQGRTYTVPREGDEAGRPYRFVLSDLIREARK